MNDESIAAQARAADLAKVRRARGMACFVKFEAGAALFEDACRWSLAGISHDNPSWTSDELNKELRRRLQIATHP